MSELKQTRTEESLRHEYSEVLQNIRNFQNLRYAIFSVFIAIMAGLGLVAFGKGQFGPDAALMARVTAILVIAVFWLEDERLTRHFEHFLSMAIELERILGYKQWTALPRSRLWMGNVLRRSIIWRTFFLLLTLLWFYGIFAVPLDR